MATELIELGSIQPGVLTVDGFGMGQGDSPLFRGENPLIELKRLVLDFEDPFSGEGEFGAATRVIPTDRAARIANELKRRSAIMRRRLRPEGAELAGMDSIVAMEGLRAELAQEILAMEGFRKVFKKVGRGIKKVSKKVVKVVKSPAFLSVAGLAANLIPGVGPLVSAGLGAAASAMAARQRAKGKELSALDVIGESVVLPVSSALAFPQLSKDVTGMLKGLGLSDKVTKSILDKAGGLVPALKAQGKADFMSTALKAIGGLVSSSDLVKGLGAKIPGLDQLIGSGLIDAIKGAGGRGVQDAIGAADRDLLNAAAADGNIGNIQRGLDDGRKSEFPTTEVVIGATGFVLLITTVVLVTRK